MVWGHSPNRFNNAFYGMNKRIDIMATKTTQNPETMQATETTAKRTRKVIKWEDAHNRFTCEALSLLMDNHGNKRLATVAGYVQHVLESMTQTVKTGKVDRVMIERRDNLALALIVADMDKSEILERLDSFIDLFR